MHSATADADSRADEHRNAAPDRYLDGDDNSDTYEDRNTDRYKNSYANAHSYRDSDRNARGGIAVSVLHLDEASQCPSHAC